MPRCKLQHRRDEAEAVGDHRTLHHVQFGEDDEDEQRKTNDVHRLEDEDNEEVGERRPSARLEEADPEAANECAKLRDEEGKEEAPGPRNPLCGGQLGLVLPSPFQIMAAVLHRPDRDSSIKICPDKKSRFDQIDEYLSGLIWLVMKSVVPFVTTPQTSTTQNVSIYAMT